MRETFSYLRGVLRDAVAASRGTPFPFVRAESEAEVAVAAAPEAAADAVVVAGVLARTRLEPALVMPVRISDNGPQFIATDFEQHRREARALRDMPEPGCIGRLLSRRRLAR